MTSSEPPAAVRRPRRAVRQAGTVGGDDADLVSSHPAFPVDTRRDDATDDAASGTTASHDDRLAVPGGAGDRGPTTAPPDPAIATRSADDSDVGWGDRDGGSNDDRLHQDKPPHW